MPTNNPKFSFRKNQLNDYVRYSALGFQMAIVIFIATWAGVKLDALLHLSVPVFTLFFSILSVVGVLYYFIRGFVPKKK